MESWASYSPRRSLPVLPCRCRREWANWWVSHGWKILYTIWQHQMHKAVCGRISWILLPMDWPWFPVCPTALDFFCHWGWQITWLRNQKVQRLLPDARDSEVCISIFDVFWYTQHIRCFRHRTWRQFHGLPLNVGEPSRVLGHSTWRYTCTITQL